MGCAVKMRKGDRNTLEMKMGIEIPVFMSFLGVNTLFFDI
jgi:hypothetical protein